MYKALIFLVLCFIVSIPFFFLGDEETPTICPTDTCIHGHSRDFTISYSSELNINSTCAEIKNYILANLERSNHDAFQSSDGSSITDLMKKELIFVLENSSTMEMNDGRTGPGIRFKFCCPTEGDCLL